MPFTGHEGAGEGLREKQPSTQGPGSPPAARPNASRSLCTEPFNPGGVG